MKIKEKENKKITPVFFYDDVYFKKNNIIIDKTCPKCSKIIFKDRDFCSCGFFLKAHKNSVLYSIAVILGIFLFLVFSLFIINFKTNKYFKIAQSQMKNINFQEVSPPHIQMLSKIKNSSYKDYVQSVYIDPKKDYSLVIIIKPSLWKIMKEDEKNKLFNKISKEWEKLYRQKHPGSNLTTETRFANSL